MHIGEFVRQNPPDDFVLTPLGLNEEEDATTRCWSCGLESSY